MKVSNKKFTYNNNHDKLIATNMVSLALLKYQYFPKEQIYVVTRETRIICDEV